MFLWRKTRGFFGGSVEKGETPVQAERQI